MSEFRYDWFTDRWVIFAPQRSHRPHEFSECTEAALTSSDCPFCVGNESETPVPVLMLPTLDAKKTSTSPTRSKDKSKEVAANSAGTSRRRHLTPLSAPNWKVRVVPNKYPALKPLPEELHDSVLHAHLMLHATALQTVERSIPSHDEVITPPAVNPLSRHRKNSPLPTSPESENLRSLDLYQNGNFHGAHEVFVECGEHKTSLTELPTDHVQLILRSYAARLQFWRLQKAFRYGVVFKNSGAAAGATLSHLHSQLMVTSFLPTETQRLQERWNRYYSQHQSCPVCDMVQIERNSGSRLVWESEHFVAICPYASRSPYFISIYPKEHQSTFEANLESVEAELASYLLRTIKALESALSSPSYNYIIHTAPFAETDTSPFHWRIDLFPRLGKLAGFEWASGSQINSILPEEAARTLRLYFATSPLE